MNNILNREQTIHPTARFHPQACIDFDSVKVGRHTRVWQFASIIRGAELGEECNVASGACVDGSRLGNRCVIGHNIAMGPGFWVGDDCFIGPNTTFCNDLWPRTHKRGFDPALFDGSQWAVRMFDGASIGANCAILPGVVIGFHAMIAAGSVVTQDVPDFHVWRDGAAKPYGDPDAKTRMRFVK